MKKITILAMAAAIGLAANAQQGGATNKGDFETKDFGSFKLHVYNSNDVMSDASYIIEAPNALVTMEQPLFKDNAAEFDRYLGSLGKPVAKRIADYHLGGTGDSELVMAEGMAAFTKQGAYAAMMEGFAKNFGDAIVSLPTGKAEEIAFGKAMTCDGVEFSFSHGVASDFPAASINIGGKAYFSHWAPAKAHMNALQITSPEAIDAEITEADNALRSGCEVFIGGHGGMADKSAEEFKAKYLRTMKEIYRGNKTAQTFVAAMKQAFPSLAGEDGLEAVANNLYK